MEWKTAISDIEKGIHVPSSFKQLCGKHFDYTRLVNYLHLHVP